MLKKYEHPCFRLSVGLIWRDVLNVKSGWWLNPEKSFYPDQRFPLQMNGRLKEICECYWRNWLTLDASNSFSFMTGTHWGTLAMPDIIDSEVFLAFSTYATIVILKMMFMGPLTGYFRFTRKVTEDTHMSCNKSLSRGEYGAAYLNDTDTYKTSSHHLLLNIPLAECCICYLFHDKVSGVALWFPHIADVVTKVFLLLAPTKKRAKINLLSSLTIFQPSQCVGEEKSNTVQHISGEM